MTKITIKTIWVQKVILKKKMIITKRRDNKINKKKFVNHLRDYVLDDKSQIP